MDSESTFKYVLALILLSGYIHCNPRQNDDTLYTLYNNRRGENTVIRVHPDRKFEPAYGYPSAEQEALYRYQLYNGGLTQIDYPQTDDQLYAFQKDLSEQPIIPVQPMHLQPQAGPPSGNEASPNIAQLQQQQKQLEQSQQQQLQPTQQQFALQNQQKQREQPALQGGSSQQTSNPQSAVRNPLPTAVYGILIKQPNQVVTTKNSEEKPSSSSLHRPESRIVAQAIPQQQGPANNIGRLPSGLGAANGLPVLPPIFGIHNGVLGKVPLPFPNVPAYGISQYGSAPQKQSPIGSEYINIPSSIQQKGSHENLSPPGIQNAQTNVGEQLPQRAVPDKQISTGSSTKPGAQLPTQHQTVYFDDEKEHKLTESVPYNDQEPRRLNKTPPNQSPSFQQPNTPKPDDQLKLLSSYQNQQRTNYQDTIRGAITPLQHPNSPQQQLTKLSNHASYLESPSYLPQSQKDSFDHPVANSYKQPSQPNKPRIRNQNEQYPLGPVGDHLGISDDTDFDDDYTTSHREVRPRNRKTERKPHVAPIAPPIILEPAPTSTLAPTSPIPKETVTEAPTQPDYSQNYESSDNTHDEEDDVPPPHFFSDEDRFGSRISKSAQHEAPFIQQSTITQAQPSALLSAQLSVQESQSLFPSATITPTQTPNRKGAEHFQQLPYALNNGGANVQFPQNGRNILPQSQVQPQNIQFQQNYNAQQLALGANLPSNGQIQHGVAAYNQEGTNQNTNGFPNQYEKTPLLTQQRPSSSGFLPATQHSRDDLEKKQTEEVPKRQRSRRRKNRQRSSRNRQPTVRPTVNNEQQMPLKETDARTPQYQQQQHYTRGQAQNSYPPQQPIQNIAPNLNDRPGAISPVIGYPTNSVPPQNQQSNISPQQPAQSYSHTASNNPSQYFTRNSGSQLQKTHTPITPNLVSYPEVATKPSIHYVSNQRNEANKQGNTPHQAAYGHSQPQQHNSQFNVPSPNNYQNSLPQNYPATYNIPTPGNGPSFVANNVPQTPNPSLYRQESNPQRNVGNYRPDLSQQSSVYDVSGIQQNQDKIPQQSSLRTEEDKPVPSLSETAPTPSPPQEATTSRSTNRSRFGQRRKGRGRSRQQKGRSKNVIKDVDSQVQPEAALDRGHTQSLPLQQQGPTHDPRATLNQPFNPAYNSPANQQQTQPQNAAYNSQADAKAKQSLLQQPQAPLNPYNGQQLRSHQPKNVAQQYNAPQQSYNTAPQQIPNYNNAQKQPELGSNLPLNRPPQVPYHTGYGQQQPQLTTGNAPQAALSNAGNNRYPFQQNYGQGPLQTAQGNYQDSLQQNANSQFYKRADEVDAVDDDYSEEYEDDENYES